MNNGQNLLQVFLYKDGKDSTGLHTRSCQTIRRQIKLFTLEQIVTDNPGVLYPAIQKCPYPEYPYPYIFATGLFDILVYNSYLLVINLNVYICFILSAL